MLSGKLRWLLLVICLLCVTAHGQEMKLEPGKTVERELAGGQEQNYQINITAGQFVHFRLNQQAIDDKSGVTMRQQIILRLPFTPQEATRLLALAPKNSSFGAMDFQANRQTVLNADLAQY